MAEKTTPLNLYRIRGTASGWDTYNGAIVAAPDEATARRIHPEDGSMQGEPDREDTLFFNGWDERWDTITKSVEKPEFPGRLSWAVSPDDVTAECVGVAAEGIEQGVILASFRAG